MSGNQSKMKVNSTKLIAILVIATAVASLSTRHRTSIALAQTTPTHTVTVPQPQNPTPTHTITVPQPQTVSQPSACDYTRAKSEYKASQVSSLQTVYTGRRARINIFRRVPGCDKVDYYKVKAEVQKELAAEYPCPDTYSDAYQQAITPCLATYYAITNPTEEQQATLNTCKRDNLVAQTVVTQNYFRCERINTYLEENAIPVPNTIPCDDDARSKFTEFYETYFREQQLSRTFTYPRYRSNIRRISSWPRFKQCTRSTWQPFETQVKDNLKTLCTRTVSRENSLDYKTIIERFSLKDGKVNPDLQDIVGYLNHEYIGCFERWEQHEENYRCQLAQYQTDYEACQRESIAASVQGLNEESQNALKKCSDKVSQENYIIGCKGSDKAQIESNVIQKIWGECDETKQDAYILGFVSCLRSHTDQSNIETCAKIVRKDNYVCSNKFADLEEPARDQWAVTTLPDKTKCPNYDQDSTSFAQSWGRRIFEGDTSQGTITEFSRSKNRLRTCPYYLYATALNNAKISFRTSYPCTQAIQDDYKTKITPCYQSYLQNRATDTNAFSTLNGCVLTAKDQTTDIRRCSEQLFAVDESLITSDVPCDNDAKSRYSTIYEGYFNVQYKIPKTEYDALLNALPGYRRFSQCPANDLTALNEQYQNQLEGQCQSWQQKNFKAGFKTLVEWYQADKANREQEFETYTNILRGRYFNCYKSFAAAEEEIWAPIKAKEAALLANPGAVFNDPCDDTVNGPFVSGVKACFTANPPIKDATEAQKTTQVQALNNCIEPIRNNHPECQSQFTALESKGKTEYIAEKGPTEPSPEAEQAFEQRVEQLFADLLNLRATTTTLLAQTLTTNTNTLTWVKQTQQSLDQINALFDVYPSDKLNEFLDKVKKTLESKSPNSVRLSYKVEITQKYKNCYKIGDATQKKTCLDGVENSNEVKQFFFQLAEITAEATKWAENDNNEPACYRGGFSNLRQYEDVYGSEYKKYVIALFNKDQNAKANFQSRIGGVPKLTECDYNAIDNAYIKFIEDSCTGANALATLKTQYEQLLITFKQDNNQDNLKNGAIALLNARTCDADKLMGVIRDADNKFKNSKQCGEKEKEQYKKEVDGVLKESVVKGWSGEKQTQKLANINNKKDYLLCEQLTLL